MIQRIKTSNQTSFNLDKIQNKLHLSSKATILRIALAISLNDPDKIDISIKYQTDQGFDISLTTLFGEYELFFRTLIKYSYQSEMDEKTYIRLIQSHIERGMIKLYGEFATNNDIKKMLNEIIEVNLWYI